MQYQNCIQKEKTTGMTKIKEEENEVLDLKCGIRQQWKILSNSSSGILCCNDRRSFCHINIHHCSVYNINTYGKQVMFEFIRNVHVCHELELSLTSCDDVWCLYLTEALCKSVIQSTERHHDNVISIIFTFNTTCSCKN